MENNINIETDRLTEEQKDVTTKIISLLLHPNADYHISVSDENEVFIQKIYSKEVKNLIIDQFGGIANSFVTSNKSGYTCEHFPYNRINDEVIKDNVNLFIK